MQTCVYPGTPPRASGGRRSAASRPSTPPSAGASGLASSRGSTSSGVAREHRRRRHRRQPHPAAAAPPRTSSSLAAASSAAGGTGVTSSAGAASAMRTARVLAKDEWSWDKHHLQALFTNDLQTIYKRGPFTNEPVTLVILANKQTNQTNEASFVNSVCEHITNAEPCLEAAPAGLFDVLSRT